MLSVRSAAASGAGRLATAALANVLLFPCTACAWDDRGHQIIAAIAYERLTPEARREAAALLAQDDDKLTPPDFVSRSTWADRWRDSDRLTPEKRRFNATRQWHFAEIDVDGGSLRAACNNFRGLRPGQLASEGPVRDCVVNKVEQFAAELKNPGTPRAEKILALKYVLHLVGDLHHPLHVSENDDVRGRTVLARSTRGETDRQPRDLVAYWSTTLVDQIAEGPRESPQAIASRLAREIPEEVAGRWAGGGPREWAADTFRVARQVAYNFEGSPSVSNQVRRTLLLTEDYDRRALPAVREQLAKAGIRLAALLNVSLAGAPSVTAPAETSRAGSTVPASTRPVARTGGQERIVFRLASEVLPPGSVKLANGIDVSTRDWPTLIMAHTEITFAPTVTTCTGTLLGPNVALIAAHCVDDPALREPAPTWLETDQREWPLVCEIHPSYIKRSNNRSPRGSEDYALCLIEDGGTPLPALSPNPPVSMRFDVVEPRIPLQRDEPVLMTGYGCSKLTVVKGKPSWTKETGTLRIGDERIDVPIRTASPDPTYVSIRSEGGREPALCPGDSGGPLFTGVSARQPAGARRIRGVNSKVGTECSRVGAGGAGSGCVYDFISSVAATGTPVFRSWAEDWVRRNQAAQPIVCGVNREAGQFPCRP